MEIPLQKLYGQMDQKYDKNVCTDNFFFILDVP